MKNTILIFSDESDISTNQVINWIEYFGFKWVRLNGNEFFNLDNEITYDPVSCKAEINGLTLLPSNSSSIYSCWYRRFGTESNSEEILRTNTLELNVGLAVDQKLRREKYRLQYSLIEQCLSSYRSLGSFAKRNLNKLTVLQYAAQIGLKVPKTIITTSREELMKFSKCFDSIITKAIYEGVSFVNGGAVYGSYTERITTDDIHQLDDNFHVSLFQEEVKKKFELRVFYIDSKLYPMAIFSQQDPQTEVDFRRYNTARGNRTVPYALDESCEDKIIQLMHKLGLNTGSIDLILGQDDEIYFLEVNPSGQYGMVSTPCNYNLDYQIAKYLCNEQ